MNPEWKTSILKDTSVEFIDGDRSSRYPKRNEFTSDGVLFLNAESIKSGYLNIETVNYISEEKFSTIKKGRLKQGDVVLTMRGNGVGQVCYFFGGPLTGLINAQMLIMRTNSHEIDSRYFFYILRSPFYFNKLLSLVTGSAQPQLSITNLQVLEISYPSLSTQHKIAAILSAYDDLIENNLRRIKILEEMAQNLYREWFVKFHFPGHQHVRFIDSPLGRIPEGWEVSALGEYLKELESGKRPKGGAQNITNGIPSVGAENIFGIGRHKYQSEKYVSREFFEAMRNGVVKDGDVALYKDGAYIGRSAYFRDSFPHAQFCVNEHVFLLRTTGKRLTQNILYLWLQEPATISTIRATNANAAQPGINKTGVNGIPLVVSPVDIAGHFDKLVEPNMALIVSLAKRNEILRRTRDLLLPKLISGEVDVSQLDITIPEEVA